MSLTVKILVEEVDINLRGYKDLSSSLNLSILGKGRHSEIRNTLTQIMENTRRVAYPFTVDVLNIDLSLTWFYLVYSGE